MKKRLIMLMMVSAFGLQEFAYAMQQQDTTKKEKKVRTTDTVKVKKDTTKVKPSK
jgi:hypothetical protein